MVLQIRNMFRNEPPKLCLSMPAAEVDDMDTNSEFARALRVAGTAGFSAGRIADVGRERLVELIHDCQIDERLAAEERRRARRVPLQRHVDRRNEGETDANRTD